MYQFCVGTHIQNTRKYASQSAVVAAVESILWLPSEQLQPVYCWSQGDLEPSMSLDDLVLTTSNIEPQLQGALLRNVQSRSLMTPLLLLHLPPHLFLLLLLFSFSLSFFRPSPFSRRPSTGGEAAVTNSLLTWLLKLLLP